MAAERAAPGSDVADREAFDSFGQAGSGDLREMHYRALAEAVESSEEFVGICDLELRPQYVNPAGRRMVGLTSMSEALERDVLDYFWPEDRERVLREALPALERDDRWRGEVRFRNFQTGEPVHTLWSVSVIRDERGEALGYATVSPNLTPIKETELELRDATQRLEELNREKDRFLGLLGHELRNPLGAIQNALEVLRATDSEEEARAMQGVLERQTALVARLVDDLVDLARVQTGVLSLNPEPSDLAGFVQEVIRERLAEAEQLGVRLHVEIPDAEVPVRLDRARMGQVLHNLLTNAFRANPGGHVLLRLGVDDEGAVISVEDRGRGIPAEDLGRIFEPFEQLSRHAGVSQGLGLGLPLALEFVRRHGGRLTVTSGGAGRGAEFVVRLPLSTDALPERSATAVGGEPSEPRRIVIIDDHEDSANSLAQLLKMKRHQVDVAHRGAAGLDLVRRRRPHAVILDICMPGMDGYEVARAIRSLEARPAPLCIGLTGLTGRDARHAALEAGFDVSLTKPVDLEKLLGILERISV